MAPRRHMTRARVSWRYADMDDLTRRALGQDRTIDITTVGRKSGQPRRVEIWFHNLEGRIFITGAPGTRSWYANLKANPEFTFHLKESTQADLPARARPIIDSAERREVIRGILPHVGRDPSELQRWVERCPLVEVELLEE